jgi:hypothetical protein
VPPFPFDLPADPSRPVLHALARACAKNWDAFFDTIMKAGVEANRPPAEQELDVVQMVQSALAHIESVAEITRWIFPLAPPLATQEAEVKAQQFSALGQDYVEELVSRLQKLPAHRPSKRRQSHIAAFEFMLRSKRNSLGQAVLNFCPCGGTHSTKCHANLKAGIHALKKVLRKYAPELVDQYDVLHPDRDTKKHT